jgi:hypothetical protein
MLNVLRSVLAILKFLEISIMINAGNEKLGTRSTLVSLII